MKYWLKECPKCHGDLREEPDIYDKYISCMQCGYTLRHEEEVVLLVTGTLKEMVTASQKAA